MGRIELYQAQLQENFLQREERGYVGLGFPVHEDEDGKKLSPRME